MLKFSHHHIGGYNAYSRVLFRSPLPHNDFICKRVGKLSGMEVKGTLTYCFQWFKLQMTSLSLFIPVDDAINYTNSRYRSFSEPGIGLKQRWEYENWNQQTQSHSYSVNGRQGISQLRSIRRLPPLPHHYSQRPSWILATMFADSMQTGQCIYNRWGIYCN